MAPLIEVLVVLVVLVALVVVGIGQIVNITLLIETKKQSLVGDAIERNKIVYPDTGYNGCGNHPVLQMVPLLTLPALLTVTPTRPLPLMTSH